MSKIDSFFNLSPLTTVSRKIISFSDISAGNLMVGGNLMIGWNLLACSIKWTKSFFLSLSLIERRYRQYIVSILLAWFRFVVSALFQF